MSGGHLAGFKNVTVVKKTNVCFAGKVFVRRI